MSINNTQYDVIVIGSGAAGLTLALRAADTCSVAVLSKGDLHQGATFYAQGGIAAVLDETDSIESHASDTFAAGANLGDPEIIKYIVENSRNVVQWLI